MPTIAEKRARFAELHAAPGCFVLPNPFDIGSARYLASLGFPALASTSAGMAFVAGRGDGAITGLRRSAISAILLLRPICRSTPISRRDSPTMRKAYTRARASASAPASRGSRSRTTPAIHARPSTVWARRSSGCARRARRSTQAAKRFCSPAGAKRSCARPAVLPKRCAALRPTPKRALTFSTRRGCERPMRSPRWFGSRASSRSTCSSAARIYQKPARGSRRQADQRWRIARAAWGGFSAGGEGHRRARAVRRLRRPADHGRDHRGFREQGLKSAGHFRSGGSLQTAFERGPMKIADVGFSKARASDCRSLGGEFAGGAQPAI